MNRINLKRRKKLKSLAIMMNSQNISPVPINSSLIDCFESVINPDETDFLLKMGKEPYSFDKLKQISNLENNEFKKFIENILKKGLVHTRPGAGEDMEYILTPILVGWFEIFLSDGDENKVKNEFAENVENYFESFRNLNVAPLRNIINFYMRKTSIPNKTIALIDNRKSKTVNINQKIAAGPSSIIMTKTVNELIEKHGRDKKIALMHCFCRQWHKMIGHECRFDIPAESCLAIGDISRYIIDNNIGRYISMGDAHKLVLNLQKKGAIHTVFYESEDINKGELGICNCCWDCCGVHGSYNRRRSHLNLMAYYYADLPDPALCTGCGICNTFCPTEAICINDKKAYINVDLCIGCGQCSFQCPSNAITMTSNKRHVLLPFKKRSTARL